jgi:hypothetical protein
MLHSQEAGLKACMEELGPLQRNSNWPQGLPANVIPNVFVAHRQFGFGSLVDSQWRMVRTKSWCSARTKKHRNIWKGLEAQMAVAQSLLAGLGYDRCSLPSCASAKNAMDLDASLQANLQAPPKASSQMEQPASACCVCQICRGT